jgi:predicted nucleic acid-binding protein
LALLSSIPRCFEPLPVNASYGELPAVTHRARREASARKLGLMIAATAHAHGARLVTANVEDVPHLDGLIEIVAG